MAISSTKLAVAQQTPGESLGNSAALERQGLEQENEPYTVKWGDFKLLAAPSLGLQWNDNINLSHDQALSDYIVTPALQLDASYPFSHRNLIRLNVDVGYDKYIQHDEYSGVRLLSGSQFSLDVYIKDFLINLHDQFQYTLDTADQPDVAGSGLYGGLNNTAGVAGTWDLEDVILTLGYDHINFVSASSQFDYTTSTSERGSTQAGIHFNPALTAGAEGSVTFTDYKQPVLNNNTSYDAGVYADWRPGLYFGAKLRGGYTFYDFSQTSLVVPAVNQSSWYVDLEITHHMTAAFSYSLTAGHEIRPGIEADTVTAWHVGPRVDWAFIKDWTLAASYFYENGTLGSSIVPGVPSEHYEWSGFDFGLTHNLTDELSLGLNYRFIVRSSDIASREYTQNLVGLGLTYKLK